MTYQPTRTEARTFVVALCLVLPLAAVDARTGAVLAHLLVLPPVVAGVACQTRVFAREAGVPAGLLLRVYFLPFTGDRALRRYVSTMPFATFRRAWWRAVCAAAGWRGPAVAAAVVASVAVSLLVVAL